MIFMCCTNGRLDTRELGDLPEKLHRKYVQPLVLGAGGLETRSGAVSVLKL